MDERSWYYTTLLPHPSVSHPLLCVAELTPCLLQIVLDNVDLTVRQVSGIGV